MTYKPGFPISPIDVINLMGWEAMQLSEYIKHPPVVRGDDGNIRLDISPEELLRRSSRLFALAQDIQAFAEAERAKQPPMPPPAAEAHENGAAMN